MTMTVTELKLKVEMSHKCSMCLVPSGDTGEGQGMTDTLDGNNAGSDCSGSTALGGLPCYIKPQGRGGASFNGKH